MVGIGPADQKRVSKYWGASIIRGGCNKFCDGIIFDGPDCCPCSETGTSDGRELMGVWGGKKTKLCFQKCPGGKVYKIGRLFCFPYQFF